MFDFISYMEKLTASNRLAVSNGFKHSTNSGISYLEGMLEQYTRTANFVSTSDVCSETRFLSSGGWFKRRVFTVFVLMRYKYGDAKDCAAKLATCRELFRQFESRFIHDTEALGNQLVYLNAEDVRSNEIGGTFLNGCTGLYFMISLDEPSELVYNATEWITEEEDTTDGTTNE